MRAKLSHLPFVVDSLSKKGALSYPVALGCAESLQFPLGTDLEEEAHEETEEEAPKDETEIKVDSIHG